MCEPWLGALVGLVGKMIDRRKSFDLIIFFFDWGLMIGLELIWTKEGMTGTGAVGLRKRLKKILGFLTKSRRGKRRTQRIRICGTAYGYICTKKPLRAVNL